MKIIHTADWHLGKVVNNFPLLADQMQTLDQWLEEVVHLAPDLVIMAGDLYDRSLPNRETVAAVNDLLTAMVSRLTCPICVIAGNHDGAERINYASSLLSKQNLYMVGLPSSEPSKLALDQADVYFIPFANHLQWAQVYPNQSIHSIEEAIATHMAVIKEDWNPKKMNIAIYHGYVSPENQARDDQGQLIYSDSERPTEIGTSEYVPHHLFADFDYVALGHLHAPQKAGSERIRYSGSPLKYSKSEANHHKQYLEVDLKAENILVTSHDFHPPHDLRVLRASFADLMLNPSEDYVFVELTDQQVVHDGMNRLRRVYPNIMGLDYINIHPQSPSPNLEKNIKKLDQLSADELFQEFYQEVTGQPLNAAQREISSEIWRDIEGSD